MDDSLRKQLEAREQLLARVRRVLIEALNLRIPEDQIDPDAALFGTGLGLDSVDALELIVALEGEFHLKFPDAGLQTSLRTVNSVGDLVESLVPAAVAS